MSALSGASFVGSSSRLIRWLGLDGNDGAFLYFHRGQFTLCD